MTEIREITDPLGRYWKQPKVSEILVDDDCAIMSLDAFNLLATYSASIPSGVYCGKMWKNSDNPDVAKLIWYEDNHRFNEKGVPLMDINYRKIYLL